MSEHTPDYDVFWGRLLGRLRALADEGFALVRFYGDVCPRCHTQSNAHIHNLTAVLDRGEGGA